MAGFEEEEEDEGEDGDEGLGQTGKCWIFLEIAKMDLIFSQNW
jgi:hypothetical protein